MMVSGMRRIGAGNPALHRFRVSLTFVLSGHREVDEMIDHHLWRDVLNITLCQEPHQAWRPRL
jgi:hypothetical protein